MIRLYSYVVARDYGFAPNPFYGYCTLATCKPEIRRTSRVGDWIIGTGSKSKGRNCYLVYAMKVRETLAFNKYWEDARFRQKQPNLLGSKKQAFGDNIYFKDARGKWRQQDSHHSYEEGSPNRHNILNDTKADRVLIGTEYAYWGKDGPQLPPEFRNYNGRDICAKRGYKNQFPEAMVKDFIVWFKSLGAQGNLGTPGDWDRTA